LARWVMAWFPIRSPALEVHQKLDEALLLHLMAYIEGLAQKLEG
jgi:hypothetical protein